MFWVPVMYGTRLPYGPFGKRDSIIIDLWGAFNQRDNVSPIVRRLADIYHHSSCHG